MSQQPLPLASTLNWQEGRLSALESDWMAVHRFLWLNSFDGAHLWRMLRQRHKGFPYGTSSSQDFGVEMLQWAATAEVGRSISSKSARVILGENADYVNLDDSIRYCPACLEQHFHSPVFQLSSVHTCPLHGLLLEKSCRACGLPIGAQRLVPDEFKHPLACRRCAAPFSTGLLTAFVEDDSKAVSVFTRMDRMLRSIGKVQVQQFLGLCHPDSELPGFDRFLIQGLLKGARVRDDEVEELTGCDFTGLEFLQDATAVEQKGKCDAPAAFPSTVAADAAAARSIHRYLSKATRDICGHAKPARMSCIKEDLPFAPTSHCLLFSKDHCPCCAALTWWRAQASKIVALHRSVRSIEAQGYSVDDLHDHFHRSLSLEPRLFARSLMTLFCRLAAAVSEIVDPPPDGSSWYSVYALGGTGLSPYTARRADWGAEAAWAVWLPIERYRLEPNVMRIKVDDAIAEVAYSLSGALSALRHCQALRQAHSASLPDEATDEDPWFPEMARYSLGRWARLENLALSGADAASNVPPGPRLASPAR